MTKKIYKNREREFKGKLTKFTDLPKEICKNFLEIKNIIVESIGRNVDLYVYGSFLDGWWDEYSDYDLVFIEPLIEIKLIDKTKFKHKVDLFFMPYYKGIIKIN